MNKAIKKLCNVHVIQEVQKRYRIDPCTLTNLNGNESFVYSYSSRNKEFVLKITHSFHRSFEQIMAEVDWLQYLDAHGVKVSLATLSINGQYVEKIDCGDSYFSAVSYEKAKGKIVKQHSHDSNLLQNWGRTMGRIHNVSKDYHCTSLTIKRPEWNENKYLDISKWLPSDFTSIIQAFNNIYEKLRILPKGINDYGLIHSDLHHQNFLLDNNQITVIDFDDSEYSWFINDIAKTVYNETFNFSVHPKERSEFAQFFLHHFMIGYLRENSIDSILMKHFNDFLQFRHIFVFTRKYQKINSGKNHSYEKKLINKFHFDLEEVIPLLEFNRVNCTIK